LRGECPTKRYISVFFWNSKIWLMRTQLLSHEWSTYKSYFLVWDRIPTIHSCDVLT